MSIKGTSCSCQSFHIFFPVSPFKIGKPSVPFSVQHWNISRCFLKMMRYGRCGHHKQNTSYWEKTGAWLFSSCTVTTTVQELFRPSKNIIVPSVSDSRSSRKWLLLQEQAVLLLTAWGVNMATSSPPCRSSKATDSVGDAANVSCPGAPIVYIFSFVTALCSPSAPQQNGHRNLGCVLQI